MTTTQTQDKPKFNLWKAFVRLQNPMMKWLLNSPLHFFVSRYYMLITFTGRKSGKTYTTPVQYKRRGDTIYVISNRQYIWWKNLQGGAEVTMRIQGGDFIGTADVSLKSHDIREAIELIYPSMKSEQKDKFVDDTVVLQIEV